MRTQALALLVLLMCVQPSSSREPGSLLLTMLIKNEREHLSRSLPKWAPLIDSWIIGIDSNNTDDSEAVIRKHIGHMPGELMVVEFDGMGPTWTQIVQRGLLLFPNITHGILSDADFTPFVTFLNKMELDVRCSKHMFEIRSHDNTIRKMDWIYRNIPGVTVERRTHQALQVPDIPGAQEAGWPFMTKIELLVDEHPGGYQDRNANKSGRYIHWLEKDLEERPGDGRTMYYLGHGHLELWIANPVFEDSDSVYHLQTALKWFKVRTGVRQGYFEERWFAMSKSAEICERFYGNYTCSLGYWNMAKKLDPDRADSFFYIAQHHNMMREFGKAWMELKACLTLPVPRRSLFVWMDMYNCLRYREMARAVMGAPLYLELSDWKLVKKAGKAHTCKNLDEAKEVDSAVKLAQAKIKELKGKEPVAPSTTAMVPPPSLEKSSRRHQGKETPKKSANAGNKNSKGKEAKTESVAISLGDDVSDGARMIGSDGARMIGSDGARMIGSDGARMIGSDGARIRNSVGALREWSATYMLVLSQAVPDAQLSAGLSSAIDSVLDLDGQEEVACRTYLAASQRYLSLFSQEKPAIRGSLLNHGGIATGAWFCLLEVTVDLWSACRSVEQV